MQTEIGLFVTQFGKNKKCLKLYPADHHGGIASRVGGIADLILAKGCLVLQGIKGSEGL